MITKDYEIQPTKAQSVSLRCDLMLSHALTTAKETGGEIVLTIEDRGSLGIVAKLHCGSITAWADIGSHGKVHASYSNVWGK